MDPNRTQMADRSKRGFASMDGERQREIARKGGESVPAEKRSFFLNRALAKESGRKGGQAVADEDRSFSQDRALAAAAGRKGGHASRERLARRRSDDQSMDDQASEDGEAN